MDCTQAANSGIIETLQTSDPKLKIGIDWIFHQHGNIVSLKCIGKLLHGKGIDHSARSDPKNVYVVTKGGFNVEWLLPWQ